jgi:hypothetical protein
MRLGCLKRLSLVCSTPGAKEEEEEAQEEKEEEHVVEGQ